MKISTARSRARRLELDWPLAAVGLVGTCLAALCAPSLVGGDSGWWFTSAFGGNTTVNYVIFYTGLLCTLGAWVGIGLRLRKHARTRPIDLTATLIVWAVPLLLAPPVFSGDIYSYLAQGTLLHLGLNPYHVAPAALAHLHHVALANSVSPFWRNNTSPYGPLFIGAMSMVAALTSSVDLGVTLARFAELLGILALAVAVPRIAQSNGADPTRAVWLCVLSPLTLFGLLSPGHNDALMIGILALGVALAVERRPLLGITLCMLASAVKAPAAIAAGVILFCWLRETGTSAKRWRRGTAALSVALVVLLAASFATGLGVGWLSPSVLATPGRVHLAITPVSEIAWILHAAASSIAIHGAQGVVGKITFGCALAIGLWILWRAHQSSLASSCGIILLVFAALGPAAWPWYFTWGISLVATDSRLQRSWLLVAGVVIGSVVIKPDGILAFPYSTAPLFLLVYVSIALAIWLRRRRSKRHDAAAAATNVAT